MQIIKNYINEFLLRVARKANYKFLLKSWEPLFDLTYSSQVLETKRFSQQLRTIELEKPEAGSILIIAPHADDDIFGLGGTILKLRENNSKISTIYVTDVGDNAEEIKQLQNEADGISKSIGADIHFLHCKPGRIPVDDQDVNSKFADIINSVKPEIIFTTFILDDHDDHRRVNHLLLNVLKNINVKPEIWSYQIYSSIFPNIAIDITAYAEEKIKIMSKFKTIKGGRDWGHYIMGLNAVNSRYLPGKAKKYVETFFVLPHPEFVQLAETYFSNPSEKLYNRFYKE